MADYIPGRFHIDSFLTNYLLGYRPRDFIGDMIFPVVPVAKQSNVFAKIDKGNWFRDESLERAIGTGANEIGYTVSSDTYSVKNYAAKTVMPWETLDNADPPHAVAQRAAEFLADKLALNFEIRVEAAITGGVGSSTTLTGVNAWNDFANSDPLTNIEVGREAIRSTTGYTPNLCVMGEKTWLKLRRHPDIVRAIYPGAGVGGTASPEQFSNLIGVGRTLIGRTIKNTATEGAADVFTDVWSTQCRLLYVDGNPGIMSPTFGISFRWQGPNIGSGGPGSITIERSRDEDRRVDILRGNYYQSEKIVAAELGFQIATGITA